jgi:hypothetical protein
MEKISAKLAGAQVTAIALDMEGELYLRILKEGKSSIQRYDRGGISILFGNRREIELSPQPAGSRPVGLAVNGNGDVHVLSRVPGGKGRGAAGREVLEVFGSDGRPRKAREELSVIRKARADGFGRATALGRRGSLVVVTDAAGNAIASFGPGGEGRFPRFLGSAAVMSDEAVYVFDAENGRVVRGKITFAKRAELPVE